MEEFWSQTHGKWKSILGKAGLGSQYLTPRKECPCPMCGGKDRYTFTDYDGNGNYFCRGCGAGNGLHLLTFLNPGKDTKELINMALSFAGGAKSDFTQRKTKEKSLESLKNILRNSVKVEKGSHVDLYLSERGIDLPRFPNDLMLYKNCPYWENGTERFFDAMISILRTPSGKVRTVQRTYLNNNRKAGVTVPKKNLSGINPNGAGIYLFDMSAKPDKIGIAEGVETALSCCMMSGLPMLATTGTVQLEKVEIPNFVNRITIFGDNDRKFGGQKSAYILANRLALQNYGVEVEICPDIGDDWADFYQKRGEKTYERKHR